LTDAAKVTAMAGRTISSPASLAAVVREGIDDVLGRGPIFGAQPLGHRIDPRGLGGYYCDFRHKALYEAEHPGGFAPLVIPTAQTALGYWELMLDGQPTRDRFLHHADMLVDLARPAPAGDGMAWYCDLPLEKYALPAGWITAMGQGEAISVLLRAHDLTGHEHYAELARAAFGPFEHAVEAGGVTRHIDGRLVLEEYATAKPAAILNGWIFALFGVHELAVATGHERARALRDESLDGLLALLPRYDVGWWSRYSLYDHDGRTDLAKPFYQRLHPTLLEAVNMLRPDPRLPAMADRWRRQRTARATTRVLAGKLIFRLAWERNSSERGGGPGANHPTAPGGPGALATATGQQSTD
jgi:heparosan-N-sulfate-glucuronate 5-epimerase